MRLVFNPYAYLFSLAFSAFVIVMMFFLGSRSVKRTNIIDIVQESHKSEPIRDVPRWYGPVGIGLLALGAFLGYMSSGFFVQVLHWYPPEGLTAVFYVPALIGLYMILLHTVVNGWNGKKKLYKDLIATSQMRFQGRQTVRNMLVMTLLIAGAYFGSFYTPMLGTGSMIEYDTRPVDYVYNSVYKSTSACFRAFFLWITISFNRAKIYFITLSLYFLVILYKRPHPFGCGPNIYFLENSPDCQNTSVICI